MDKFTYERLLDNLKREYKYLQLDDSVYEDAIDYAENKCRRKSLPLIERARFYIDHYTVSLAKKDENFKKILMDKLSYISNQMAYRYKIKASDIDECYENVFTKVINKYNSRDTLIANIRSAYKELYGNDTTEKKKTTGNKQIVINVRSSNIYNKKEIKEKKLDNLKFLNSFIIKNNISLYTFSKFVDINQSILYDYLVLGREVPQYTLNKILSKCNCTTIEELYDNLDNVKKMILADKKNEIQQQKMNEKNKIQQQKTNEKNKSYDISFLSNEIKTKSDIKKFARDLEANLQSVELWLSNQKKMPGYYLDKLLFLYKSKSYAELKGKYIKSASHKNYNKKNYNNKRYDISFIKDYLKIKGISQTEFADKIEIALSTLGKWFKNGVPSYELSKILNYFNVNSYEELKELCEKEIEENLSNINKKYDISFLSDYLKINDISQTEFADKIEIAKPTLSIWLKYGVPFNQLPRILKYFNVNSYEELKELCKKDLEKISYNIRGKYDISFLRDYLKIKGIFQKKFAKEIGISFSTLNSWLNDGVRFRQLTKILNYFNVNSYEELKELCEKEIKQKTSNTHKKYDISFLNDYLKIKGILQKNFAKEMGISKQTLVTWLKDGIPFKQLPKILNYFNVNSYEELKELCEKEIEKISSNISEIYDISFLKDYLKIKRIPQIEFTKEIGVTAQTLRNWLKNGIPFKQLYRILNWFNVNSYEELKEFCKEEKENVLSNIGKIYDISFLKYYLKTKNILQREFAKEIGISESTLSKWLKCGVSSYELPRILNYFNVDSYEELKELCEKEIGKISYNISEKYDISFLKYYLKIKRISQKEFAEQLEITESTLGRWLKYGILFINLSKILNYFNVNSYEELKELCEKEIEENLSNTSEKYDISFLIDYLKIKGPSQAKVAKELGISESALRKWSKDGVPFKKLPMILNYFNVNSYEELKELCEKEIEKISSNIIEKYDISFLSDYLKIKGPSQAKVAKELGFSPSALSKWIRDGIPFKYLAKILNYFNVNSYEELKELCEKEIEKNPYNIDEKYDISFLIDYLKIKGMTQEKLAEELEITKSTLGRWLNHGILFKDLPKILNYFNVNSYEELKELCEEEIKENSPSIDENYNISFLKYYLKKIGITQKELAKELEITEATLGRWLNHGIPFRQLSKILNYFNVKSYEELKELCEKEIEENLSNINENYDISFISDYLNVKGISQKKFAKEIGISESKLSKWLKCGVSSYELPKILNYFYEEVKEFCKEEIEKNSSNIDEKYDISFIKDYLKVKGISQAKFAKELDIPTSTLSTWLKDGMPVRKLSKILNYFNVNSYKELKELCEKEIKENSSNINGKYDISFLSDYLKIKGILQGEFAKEIGISSPTLSIWLKFGVSFTQLDKILNYFNVNSYEELKELCAKEIEKISSNICKIYDISFLSDYLKIKGIPQTKFAEELGVSKSTLNKWLNYGISLKLLIRILNYFNVNSYEELKELCEKEIMKNVKEIMKSDKEIIENEKEIMKSDKEIMKSDKEKKEEKYESSDDIQEKIFKISKLVNINTLNELLKNYNINELEFSVIQFLFGKINKKYYSVDEIHKITSLSKSEILSIFKKSLNVYKNSFESKYKYEYKNSSF